MYKLMIVEDEDLLREGLVTCVDWQSLGFSEVTEATDGCEALAAISQSVPDLVITDIKMPHMDGMELIQNIRIHHKQLKIIICSGYDDFAYAKQALVSDVSEYLLKPINLSELHKAVETVVSQLNVEKAHTEEVATLKQAQASSQHNERRTAYAKLLLHGSSLRATQELLPATYYAMNSQWHCVALVEQTELPLLSMEQDYMALMEIDSTFESRLTDCLRQNLPASCYQWLEILPAQSNERILCISGQSPLHAEKVADIILQVLEDHVPQFSIHRGGIHLGLEQLTRSFMDAKKASQETFSQQWQKTISPNMDSNADFQLTNFNAEPLLTEIKSGNHDNIRAQLHILLNSLYKENALSYLYNVMILHQLYFQILHLSKELGCPVDDVIGNPVVQYQKLISKRTRQEMVAVLEPLCLAIADHQATAGTKVQSIMSEVESFIRKNFAKEDLSMKEVADHVFVSVSYLSIILKKEQSKTFIEYLTQLRMAHAKHLLDESKLKAYEIAEACGYSTAAYFSTVFKGYYGVSPSSYRKNNQN